MKKILLFATAVVAIFSSCDTPRYAYSPSAHNVPLLKKQGDSKISANYSMNADINTGNDNSNRYDHNRSNGYDLQGAVAVTDHVGIQGSYFSRREKSFGDSYNGDSGVVRYKRNLSEFGVGYFTSISRKDRIFFQVFGGVGFGKLKITDASRDFNGIGVNRFYNSDIRKYYLEPAILFRNKEVFAASISTRFSVISFRNIKSDYTQDEKISYKLDSLSSYSMLFLEPAFVNSYGFNKLPGFRIEYQIGFAVPINFNLDREIYDFRPFNFSLGLVFDIGKLIRGPEEKSSN